MAQQGEPAAGRKPRADAARNHARLLATAKAVFAAKGSNASLDEIARIAGVGAGTLYRHFPNRDALVAAVFRNETEQLVAAADRLATAEAMPISIGGPQRLPAASGGVTAWKARDPDGHPVELIDFPGGPSAETWAEAPGLFLGIDHSALTVTDLDAALAFFTGALGIRLAQRGLNVGPEQARLDGLPDPEVDVLALEPAGGGPPHLELLHYRRPGTDRPTPAPFGPADRATSRLILAVTDLTAAANAIRAARYPVRVAGDVAYTAGPDGHGLVLQQSP